MPERDTIPEPDHATLTLARIPAPECVLARLSLEPEPARAPADGAAAAAAFRAALQTVRAFALEPQVGLDGARAIELYAVTPPATAPAAVAALREAVLDVVESCAPPLRAAGADGRPGGPAAPAARVAAFRAALDASAPRLLDLLDAYIAELYV